MDQPPNRVVPLLLSPLLLAAACGGAAGLGSVQPTSEFTAADAVLFEDGVDFVADPDALEGRWSDDWQRDLRARVAASDFVALVSIGTIRTDTDPEQVVTYRLVATVVREMEGDTPAEELTFTVRQGAMGFPSVENNLRRLLDRRFVVYAKWYESGPDRVDTHWHMAPGTRSVGMHTQRAIDEGDGSERPARSRTRTRTVIRR